jgi:hypothetical protein
MNTYKKAILSFMAIALISFLSSCVVVAHDHPHHHWHHGHGGGHEEIIVR